MVSDSHRSDHSYCLISFPSQWKAACHSHQQHLVFLGLEYSSTFCQMQHSQWEAETQVLFLWLASLLIINSIKNTLFFFFVLDMSVLIHWVTGYSLEYPTLSVHLLLCLEQVRHSQVALRRWEVLPKCLILYPTDWSAMNKNGNATFKAAIKWVSRNFEIFFISIKF